MSETYVLVLEERPPTVNQERAAHWREHRRETRRWREAFAWLALQRRIPRLERVAVIATQIKPNRRSMPDVGACMPAVKAAIDGLVDAGVLEDDGPEHVTELTFRAPRICPGAREALELVIRKEPNP